MGDTFTIEDATPLRDSGKAVLFDAPDLDEFEWIPKSAIHDDSEVWKTGQETGALVIHGWLADKRGWR